MKFDFLGPRDYLNQCLRSRLSIIRSNKVAYDFIDGELVLGRYTEFCRITSALSKNLKSLRGPGYPRVAYVGVFRSVWSEVLKGIGLLLAILCTSLIQRLLRSLWNPLE